MPIDEAIKNASHAATIAFPDYRIVVDRIVSGSLQIRLYADRDYRARLRWQLWDYEATTPILLDAAIYRMREELEHGSWLSLRTISELSPSEAES